MTSTITFRGQTYEITEDEAFALRLELVAAQADFDMPADDKADR